MRQPRAPYGPSRPPRQGGGGKKHPAAPLCCNNGQAHRHGFSDLRLFFFAGVPRDGRPLIRVGTHEPRLGQAQPGPGLTSKGARKKKKTAGIGELLILAEIHKTRNPRPFTGFFFGLYMHPNLESRPLDFKIVFNQHPKPPNGKTNVLRFSAHSWVVNFLFLFR